MRDDQKSDGDKPKTYKGADYILSGLVFVIAAIWNGISDNNPRDNETNDATQNIANWTKVVASWTRGLVFVGLITAAVLAAQFIILKRTDETQRAIQRAAITSYEIKINPVDTNWQISPILENAGNTVALKLRSRIMRTYFSPLWGMRRLKMTPGVDNPDLREIEFTGLPEAAVSLAPHAKISLATYVLTDKAIGMFRAGTLSSYIFGEAEYFDIFDVWHRTKFCYRLLGRTVSVQDDDIGAASNIGDIHTFVPGQIEIVKDEVLYRLCRRNNCADEQCGGKRDRPIEDRPAATLVKQPQK